MKPASRVGLVLAGYLGAVLIAALVVAIHVAFTRDAQAQASSGMYAFGDSLLFVGVSGTLALVPTALALHWLKHQPRFWVGLATLALAVASTGLVAAVTWGAFGVLRILLAPILAPVFLLCAFFTPSRPPRIALLAAAATEILVLAYALVMWFIIG